MTTTNYEWAESELSRLGYAQDGGWTGSIRRGILELLHTLDAQDLSQEDRTAVTDVFHHLVTDTPKTEKEARWVPFELGTHITGETARIRPESYEGVGAKHNGLVGVIVAIRGGRVLVQYSGRTDGVGHAHHPDKVEVLVK